jgi:hypothetical protein
VRFDQADEPVGEHHRHPQISAASRPASNPQFDGSFVITPAFDRHAAGLDNRV